MRLRILLASNKGQASVEAALLIPFVMGVIGLLLQPVCLLYTYSIMNSTAAEALRLLSTQDDRALIQAYIQRKLEAVPSLEIFHAGEWDVELTNEGTQGQVRITGHAKPLPLLSIPVRMLFESNEQGFVLSAEAQGPIKSEWQRGGYDDWIEHWDTS